MRVCVVSGSFLVSVFSSLLFLCFFLIRESLLYFITTVMSRRPPGQQLSHWSVSSEDLPGASYPPTHEDYHSSDPIILQDNTAYEFDRYVSREFTSALGRMMHYARFKQQWPFIQNHPDLLIVPLRLKEDNDQEGPSYFQSWYHRTMKVMRCCGMRN